MGTMEQVLERLEATEKRAGEVIRQLEEAESVHKSLDESRKGLAALASDVKKLISTTRKGVDELSEAVTAFKRATETIQQSDPGAITGALRGMDTRIEAIVSEVAGITEIKAELTELRETVARSASVNEERTRAMIDNAVDEVAGQSLMDRVLGKRRKAGVKRKT